MLSKIAFIALIGCVAAFESNPTFYEANQANQQGVPLQSRTGFGVNANAGYENGGLGLQGGFNTPIGDFNAQGGLRAPTFGNNNLLTGLVVFLGVLSLINILATVFVPWISNLGGGDEDEEKSIEKNVEKGRRYQRNINMVADYVLNGIESFANKHE